MKDTDILPVPSLVLNDSPPHLDGVSYGGDDDQDAPRRLCRQFRYDRRFPRATGGRQEIEPLLVRQGSRAGQELHLNLPRHWIYNYVDGCHCLKEIW